VNRAEAKSIADGVCAEWEARRYADVVPLVGKLEVVERTGPSGVAYQLEINVMWDDRPGGAIRVLVTADDGSFRGSFRPEAADCLIEPEPG
jgi:hypothetical protein